MEWWQGDLDHGEYPPLRPGPSPVLTQAQSWPKPSSRPSPERGRAGTPAGCPLEDRQAQQLGPELLARLQGVQLGRDLQQQVGPLQGADAGGGLGAAHPGP